MTEATINRFMSRGQINLAQPERKQVKPDLPEARGVILGVMIGLNMWIWAVAAYRWFL